MAPIMETKVLPLLKGGSVYLSLDIDCLDPAHAPGTGESGIISLIWVAVWYRERGRKHQMKGEFRVEIETERNNVKNGLSYNHKQQSADLSE